MTGTPTPASTPLTTDESQEDRGCSTRNVEFVGLALIIVLFAALATTVAVATPPWEANDEKDHFQNAATLAKGDLYEIEPGAGIEPHQPPLYYAVLAIQMRLAGIDLSLPTLQPNPDYAPGRALPQYDHQVQADGFDTRRVVFLRLTSIPLAVVTILSGYVLARILTDDVRIRLAVPATIAFIPRFVFLSGVMNNDNMATAFSSVAIVLAGAAICRPRWRSTSGMLVASGAFLGGGLITKLTVAPIAVAVTVLVAIFCERTMRAVASIIIPAALVSGWWFVRNTLLYGDPALTDTAASYFREVLPALILDDPNLRHMIVDIPRGLWKSIWYTSGANQFDWHWAAYVPFWLLVAVAMVGIVRGLRERSGRTFVFLGLLSLGGLSNVWIAGYHTTQHQGRIAYVALAPVAVLLVQGFARLPYSRMLMWTVPAIGLFGTLVAIRSHVLMFAF